MRLQGFLQYVFLKVRRTGRRACNAEFQTSGVCHTGERGGRGLDWLSTGFLSLFPSTLYGDLGQIVLHTRAKVAPEVVGNCLCLRHIIGGSVALTQVGNVQLCPSVLTEGRDVVECGAMSGTPKQDWLEPPSP